VFTSLEGRSFWKGKLWGVHIPSPPCNVTYICKESLCVIIELFFWQWEHLPCAKELILLPWTVPLIDHTLERGVGCLTILHLRTREHR